MIVDLQQAHVQMEERFKKQLADLERKMEAEMVEKVEELKAHLLAKYGDTPSIKQDAFANLKEKTDGILSRVDGLDHDVKAIQAHAETSAPRLPKSIWRSVGVSVFHPHVSVSNLSTASDVPRGS